jgi:hypothetical protein
MVTLYTSFFNILESCILPTESICVLYGSQNKQRLFP